MRRFAALAMTVGAAAGPLLAQCAMCRQNAAAQPPGAIEALNSGILVLLAPLLAIVAGISWVTYRLRD